MYDHGKKRYIRDNVKTSSEEQPVVKDQTERRVGDRHTFIATADIIDIVSGARFSTRTTDLGPGGCFVDTLVPFESGAKVQVHIRKGTSEFKTTGLVIYSQSGLGMGIAFDRIHPEQRRELETWVGEQASDRQSQAPRSPNAPKSPEPAASADRAALLRLLQLFLRKGMLTQAEAEAVVNESTLF
ncbi:MAG: PilZ domain-containing protein [Candidatus Acidiferrales bacterium]